MDLKIVRQITTLGKQHEMWQTKCPRYNLFRLLFRYTQLRRTVTHRDRLRCERALTGKCKGIANILDIDCLGRQQCHVATRLLEVQRRHSDASGKLCLGHRHVRIIAIQQVELVPNATLLLTVLQSDRQMIAL